MSCVKKINKEKKSQICKTELSKAICFLLKRNNNNTWCISLTAVNTRFDLYLKNLFKLNSYEYTYYVSWHIPTSNLHSLIKAFSHYALCVRHCFRSCLFASFLGFYSIFCPLCSFNQGHWVEISPSKLILLCCLPHLSLPSTVWLPKECKSQWNNKVSTFWLTFQISHLRGKARWFLSMKVSFVSCPWLNSTLSNFNC